MESQVQTVKSKKVNLVIMSIIVFILIMVAVAAQLIYTLLKYDAIYKGVSVDNIYLGNINMEDAEKVLNERYQDKVADYRLTLKSGTTSQIVSFSEINVMYDTKNAVQSAYSIGRTGNIFERLLDIYRSGKNSVDLAMPVSFDKEKLDKIIQSYYDKTLINVKDSDLLIQGDKITLKSGHHGESIDKSLVLKEIENSILKCEERNIEIPVIITKPNTINIDEIYTQISHEMKDASFKVENNEITIIPHEVGRSIDKQVIASIAAELENNENEERVLPVTFTVPKITADVAKSSLFKDTLATFSTKFNTSTENNRNRAENIKLASSKISGKILAPGDIFSFNDVVGPRTESGGYKTAHAYSGGKIIDDVGGGICQVSSTLYNVVLYSDIDVVERRNHMFTVGYVPKGSDATVSYGSTDFKFKNSTRWPIKIETEVTKDNTLIFKLIGTNEAPSGKEIVINPQIVKTIDFKTKYIDDPTLPQGTTKVKQEGMTGYVVDTYKIIKQDGKVISQKKLHTSTYRALDKEVLRGTKKAAPAPSETDKKEIPSQTNVEI